MRAPMLRILPVLWWLAGCGEDPPPVDLDARPRVETHAVAPRGSEVHRSIPVVVRAWRDVEITPLRGGRVQGRPVEVGDRVARGQVLLQLDARSAEAALAVARAALEDAEAMREELGARRRRVRALGDGASGAQIDEVEAAWLRADAGVRRAAAEVERARLEVEHHQLRAPFAGELVSLVPEVGASVGTAAPVARLVDLEHRRVEVGLLHHELEAVRAGRAHFEVSVGVERWEASLAFQAAAADPRSGMWTATLRMSDGPAPGTPGTLNLSLQEPSWEEALPVPRHAVQGGQVFVVDAGVVEPVAVAVVGARGEWLWVNGLSEGARVVTHHNQPLEAGMAVVELEAPP